MRSEDFSKIAREFSKDTTTAANGGDLGFLKWGARNFGDRFYEIAFSMRKGEISHPIKSNLGFHIIMIEGKRTVEKPSFNMLKDYLRSRYYVEKRQELELY